MEIGDLKEKIKTLWRKYKYLMLIVAVGMVLLMIPSNNPLEQTIAEVPETKIADENSISEELEHILSKVDGAGDVTVLITVEFGEQILYQTDEDISNSDNTSSTQISTVVVSGTNREEGGLIQQVNPPVYKGAIVVCEGADDPKVQLAIVEAVSDVTGLGADRISVLKMK